MIRRRNSNRLQNYDYSQKGYYFVTICTKNRECLLGEISDGKMYLSAIGKIAENFWKEIQKHFPRTELDEYVVMPNHVHGIVIVNGVGVENFQPLHRENKFQHVIPHSLGSIIRGFKIGVTKWCRNNHCGQFEWQRNFYDRIIRNEHSLQRIREYIRMNPLKWEHDRNNIHKLWGGHKARPNVENFIQNKP